MEEHDRGNSICKGPETESRSSMIMNQQGGLSGRSRMRGGRVKVRRERANGWTGRDRQEPCKALVSPDILWICWPEASTVARPGRNNQDHLPIHVP